MPKAEINGRCGMKRSSSAAETKRTETSNSSDSMPTEKDNASLSRDKESISVPEAVSVDPLESSDDQTDKKKPAAKDDFYHGDGNEPKNANFYEDPEQGNDDTHAQAMAYLQSLNGSDVNKENSFQKEHRNAENFDCDEINGTLDAAAQSIDGEVLEEEFEPNNCEAPYPGSVDTVTSLGNILVSHLEEKMRNMPIQDSSEIETRLLTSDERRERLKKILELAVRKIGPRTDTDHVAHAEAFDAGNRQALYQVSSDTTTSLASLMIHFFEEKIKSEPSSSLKKISTKADTLLPFEEDILKSVFGVLDEFLLLNVGPSTVDSSHQFVTREEAFDPDNRPAPYPGNSNTTLTLSSLLIQHLDEKVKVATSSDTEISAPTSQVAYELEAVLQSMITAIDKFNPKSNATNNDPEIDATEYSELDEAFDPDNRAAPYPGSSDTSLTLTKLLIRHLEDTVKNPPPRTESSQANQAEIIRLTPEQQQSLVDILEEAQKEIEEAMIPS